jgi:hypothetical protein
VAYVADRENGRIQKFTLGGKFIGEIPHLGRTYSLKLVGNTLWAGMQHLSEPITNLANQLLWYKKK